MSARPAARVLDVTRLVSRIGRGPLTGVDRVERAYLRALLARTEPLFLLLRTAYGFLLLPDRAGGLLLGWLDGTEALPHERGLIDRMRGRDTAEARTTQALRGLATGRATRRGLRRLLATALPQGGAYLNCGHSNLDERVLAQIGRVPGLKISVLIHDTIPLDLPHLATPASVRSFREKLVATARHADLVVCTTETARTQVVCWCDRFGRVPATLVAALGVERTAPDPAALPANLDLSRPYFLIVGTIEPRKNHMFLLDVWQAMRREWPPKEVPRLVVAGRRGWCGTEVFQRLDEVCAEADGHVVELAGLSDGAVAALAARAQAVLMPSLAEGFGLPAAEAAQVGSPLICSNLAAFREVLGDYPVYAEAGDLYSWITGIRSLTRQARSSGPGQQGASVPDWAGHFNRVLSMT